MAFDPRSDYPLGSRRRDLVKTPGGLSLDAVTLDSLRAGALSGDELRATPETLRRQGEVARAAAREQLAANLERAAELATIPTDVILEAYTALRPHRSTPHELDRWAVRLEHEYGAPRCAEFMREARMAYVERGLVAER